MPNMEYTIKQGATGASIIATLSDENGTIDLDGYTVTMTALASNRTAATVPAIDAVACVVDPDQTANEGRVTFSFDATTAGIPLGEYDIEFHATSGADMYIFPTGGTYPYGKLFITPSL